MKAGFDTNFTSIYWTYKNGFPKAADISLYIDKREGVEREIIGKVNKTHISNDNTNEGWQRPSHEGRRTMDITLPASEQAKKYQGAYAGFQPKPAVEVIVVSMKPLREKTYLDQALANNGGITWLDDLKVPYRDEKDFDSATYGAPLPDINGGNYIRPKKKQTTPDFRKEGKAVKEVTGQDKRNFNNVSNVERKEYEGDPTGRFPANLIVSDNAIDEGTIKQNGFMDSEKHSRKKSAGKHTASAYGEYDYKTVNTTYGDSGDNSRYFDLDAWFEVMVKKLPPKVQKVFPFFVTPKAAKSEKGKENTHPTVKPIQVVSYMVTMISRPGDTVIDPFAGSGTTGVVCELLGRNSHLIEQDEHYYNNILIPRIEAVTAQGKLF
jgi:site-specific DNA-methyltransferase (adenine-specific)